MSAKEEMEKGFEKQERKHLSTKIKIGDVDE
jgi:hypothetical protein